MRSNQVRLNCGITMPVIGLGTYSFQNDRKTTELAVHMALKMGYRHFDTAKIYGSESALGNALTEAMHDGKVEREDIFVTSKLWGSDHHDPVAGLKQTLNACWFSAGSLEIPTLLGQRSMIEHIHEEKSGHKNPWPRIMRIHEHGNGIFGHVPSALASEVEAMACNPIPDEDEFEPLDLETTWAGMEKCLDLGLCRCIGVSNFSTKKIEQLLDFASVPPAVNQVEMHPLWRQRKLRDFCRDHNIHVSAYSPLGGPGNSWGSTLVVNSPTIRAIANKLKATPAQVALGWGLSKGSSMIVKSFSPERIKENFGAIDLKLDGQDFMEIDKLEERKIMRGEFLVNETTSPYKTIQDLWDDEI